MYIYTYMCAYVYIHMRICTYIYAICTFANHTCYMSTKPGSTLHQPRQSPTNVLTCPLLLPLQNAATSSCQPEVSSARPLPYLAAALMRAAWCLTGSGRDAFRSLPAAQYVGLSNSKVYGTVAIVGIWSLQIFAGTAGVRWKLLRQTIQSSTRACVVNITLFELLNLAPTHLFRVRSCRILQGCRSPCLDPTYPLLIGLILVTNHTWDKTKGP